MEEEFGKAYSKAIALVYKHTCIQGAMAILFSLYRSTKLNHGSGFTRLPCRQALQKERLSSPSLPGGL